MTYDAVVIGAGLAGLAAALRLGEEGARVALVARGVGATHLSGGTIDVLGYAPERVESPARALPAFVAAHPEHPYARLAPDVVPASVEWLRGRLRSPRYVGRLDENVLLPTAIGAARPTAVTQETFASGDLRGGGRFVFVGLRGLKDFYPAYVAANVARTALPVGAAISARSLAMAPPLGEEADVNALGFARRFEDPRFLDAVTRAAKAALEPDERVGFPAVLGLDESGRVWRELEERLGRRVFEVPTLPPSVPGIRLFRALKEALRLTGARVVIGSPVTGVERRNGRVEAVSVATATPRGARYRARSFVLATGGLASGGLEMDSFRNVREPVFGLPVAGVPPTREERFRRGYLDDHPLSGAGIAVDERLRPVGPDGAPVYENVHAAGAALAGAAPWREKSGDGISLATGYAAASAVLAEAA